MKWVHKYYALPEILTLKLNVPLIPKGIPSEKLPCPRRYTINIVTATITAEIYYK